MSQPEKFHLVVKTHKIMNNFKEFFWQKILEQQAKEGTDLSSLFTKVTLNLASEKVISFLQIQQVSRMKVFAQIRSLLYLIPKTWP